VAWFDFVSGLFWFSGAYKWQCHKRIASLGLRPRIARHALIPSG